MNTPELTLIPAIAFGVVVLLALAIGYSLNRSQLRRRMEALQRRGAMTIQERLDQPLAHRTLLPMLDYIALKARRMTTKESLDRLQQRLAQAGMSSRWTATRFNGLSLICGVVCLILTPLCIAGLDTLTGAVVGDQQPTLAKQLFDPQMMLLGLGVGVLGYFMPNVVLGRRVRQRQEAILLELPRAIDLISIGIEAGMGFDQAMMCVRRRTKGPLSEEFGTTSAEMGLGRSRAEALNHLADRVDLEDVRLFVGAVLESFQLGSSLVDTLRVQAETVRIRQRQRVQERVMKAPVKILFPLVFFVFPTLMVVILGPAGIRIVKTMF
ncbi:MAG: type II secretion system F family protein [Verrucomicrobia bacterium]|nr:type II secretion system F family protein [Verrucomicrobiota bacterium]